MARELKRGGGKDFKGKKSFGPKKGKDSSDKKETSSRGDGNYSEDSVDKKKSRTEKSDNRPSFERYRDESRPSDFGSPKKRGASSEDFNKKPFKRDSDKEERPSRSAEDKGAKTFSKKPYSEKSDYSKKDSGEKRPFRKTESDKPGTFSKKTFSPKSSEVRKSKLSANPYDLDESDFEHGTEKPESGSKNGGDFKKRPYEKKPYVKRSGPGKGISKPQRAEDDGLIRLNKYISNAGISSRREADDLIKSGVVQVNGKTITEMGYRVKPTDIVKYGGQTLKKEKMVYLILNKPKDYITTADDPQQRRTVLELVQGACKERIYPVGRLDRATTGLLMFTNDGDLTKKLTHPKFGVRKIYHVELDKPLKRVDLDLIAQGIELEDGPIKVDEVTYVADAADKTQVGVEIHSGKNRIVRRIFEHMGYNVRKLDRVMFGSLTKKDLPRGRWRMLTDAEVGMLKMISAE